jgi:hypothetical protein
MWERIAFSSGLVIFDAVVDGRWVDVRREPGARWQVTVHLGAKWRVRSEFGYARERDAKRAAVKTAHALAGVAIGRRRAK